MKSILTIFGVFLAYLSIACSENKAYASPQDIYVFAPDSVDTCDAYSIQVKDSILDYPDPVPCFIYLEASGGVPPYSFAWTGPNNFMSNQSFINPVWNSGVYNVTVTDSLFCTKEKEYTISCYSSVNDLELNPAIQIQPNPASEEVKIFSTELVVGNYQLEITNILGREIVKDQVRVGPTLDKILDVSAYPMGLYFIVLTDSKGKSYLQRLMVE